MRTKMVGGKIVPMTSEEEAQCDADDARVEAEKIAPKTTFRMWSPRQEAEDMQSRITALEARPDATRIR